MLCMLAVDGLSLADLPSLLARLPRSKELVDSLSVVRLSTSGSSSQLAWAELLTARNVFQNGCAGYAHPVSSLNNLAVFSEPELLVKPGLIEVESGSSSVSINVPILRPNDESRFWLSDGSLSINKCVSPSYLRKEPIFRDYQPRPYKSHAGAMTLPQTQLIERCLDVEMDRLAGAVNLFERKNWSKFVYRVTVFDQLFHLLGLRYLAAENLAVYPALQRFLTALDEALVLFLKYQSANFALISCYSHVTCKTTLNLNLVLESGGFLQLASEDELAQNRSERSRIAATLWQPTTHYFKTLEGCLRTSSTVAASPVSGSVYVNKSSVFEDGIVPDAEYKKVRTAVADYLTDFFTTRFGGGFSIEVHPEDVNKTCAPDLIVKIEGVEFENLSRAAVPVPPLTTHSPTGFALISKKSERNNMNAPDLASLLIA